jgi:hypothetical protein
MRKMMTMIFKKVPGFPGLWRRRPWLARLVSDGWEHEIPADHEKMILDLGGPYGEKLANAVVSCIHSIILSKMDESQG